MIIERSTRHIDRGEKMSKELAKTYDPKGMEDGLIGANAKDDDVVIDGKYITSRGMGTAIKFGLALMSIFKGEQAANELSASIMSKETV